MLYTHTTFYFVSTMTSHALCLHLALGLHVKHSGYQPSVVGDETRRLRHLTDGTLSAFPQYLTLEYDIISNSDHIRVAMNGSAPLNLSFHSIITAEPIYNLPSPTVTSLSNGSLSSGGL